MITPSRKRASISFALLASACALALSAAPAGAKAVKLPASRVTPTGNTITLLAFTGPTKGVASAEVKVCTSAHTPKGTMTDPVLFTLRLTKGGAVSASLKAAKSPALKFAPLAASSCTSGWVSFTLGAGEKASELAYTYGPPIFWKLS
jgi:hypothetical protein